MPTANLGGVAEALPPYGVYAVLVDRVQQGVATTLGTGVANIGLRPTLSAGFSVEVHLFDSNKTCTTRPCAFISWRACATSRSSPVCPSSKRK